jgi:hypothetical protein
MIRFQDWWPDGIMRYWPAIGAASVALPAMVYILGLYSLQGTPLRKRERVSLLCVAFFACVIVLLAVGSLDFSSRLGRGVLALQVPIGLGLLLSQPRWPAISARNPWPATWPPCTLAPAPKSSRAWRNCTSMP